MPTTPSYTVKKAVLGKARTVHFPCPACSAQLNAPLEDAGKTQPCPDCRAPFTVPGIRERDADRRFAENEAEAKRVRDAQEDARAEQARERARGQDAADQQANAANTPTAKTQAPLCQGFYTCGWVFLIIGIIIAVIGVFVVIEASSHHDASTAAGWATISAGCAFILPALILMCIAAVGLEVHRQGQAILRR